MTLAEMLERSSPWSEFYFEDGRSYLWELSDEGEGRVSFSLHSPGCPNQGMVQPGTQKYDVRQAFLVTRSVVTLEHHYVLADSTEDADLLATGGADAHETEHLTTQLVSVSPCRVPDGIKPIVE